MRLPPRGCFWATWDAGMALGAATLGAGACWGWGREGTDLRDGAGAPRAA